MWNKNKSYSKYRAERSRWRGTTVIGILTFMTWGLTCFSKDNPHIVEKAYSSALYPFITKVISRISGLTPISFAEIMLIIIVGMISALAIFILIKPKNFLDNIQYIFHWIIRGIGLLYILFYFLWGFNYYRQDYIELSGMNKEPATLEDLQQLTQEVIVKLNNIRLDLMEDHEGVFVLEEGFKKLSQQAQIGFENLEVGGKSLGGQYGNAKPILMSKWMSYTGITGIYFPYTSEPNVNIDIPHTIIPATISHEMAHQRGFAKEEEANFIAYQVCINNPDKQFQYSGYYLAMQYLMSDLFKTDEDIYYALYSLISDGVKRDMRDSRDYWKSREGKAEKVATTMNDNYLKANNQKQGVQSYNGVVKLLLAEYKSK